jgi:hypothetical protein
MMFSPEIVSSGSVNRVVRNQGFRRNRREIATRRFSLMKPTRRCLRVADVKEDTRAGKFVAPHRHGRLV